MINLRRGLTRSRSPKMLLAALAFLACASLNAAGAGIVAALCLVPASFALDAARDDKQDEQDERLCGDAAPRNVKRSMA